MRMIRRWVLVPVILGLVSSTVSAQQANPLTLANTPVPPGQRIAYGSDSLQFGELRVPATSGPHPVAIVVHGGCWLTQLGEMDPRAVALDNMRPLAAALAEAGIATWNIEYRRLGNEGGGWPGTFQDVAAATDFLRTIAHEHSLDLSRTLAVGHSSGGHLAMWLAGRPGIASTSALYTHDPLRLTGVINLDGPADLRATIPRERQICGAPVVTDLLGGPDVDAAERLRAASPIELLPLGAAQVYFAGRLFAEQVEPYAAAAGAAGDDIRSMVLPTAGHFVFIDPGSDVWPDVLESVRQLLGVEPNAAQTPAPHSGGAVIPAGAGTPLMFCSAPGLTANVKVDSTSTGARRFAMGTGAVAAGASNAGVHDVDEAIYFLSDGGRAFVGTDTVAVVRGLVMWVPEGVHHGFISAADEPIEFVWVISPQALAGRFRAHGVPPGSVCPP
jgi:acetyl esterase/lipase/uncharacterized RmlC-like cupin family protein